MQSQPSTSKKNAFSELITETTTFGITKARVGSGGEMYDYDIIRTSQYDEFGNDFEKYTEYIMDLCERVLTEFQLLPKGPSTQAILQMGVIKERLTQTFFIFMMHKSSYEINIFDSAQFEQDFYTLFPNHPEFTNSEGSPDFGNLRTTEHFFKDLKSVVANKYGAIAYVLDSLDSSADEFTSIEKPNFLPAMQIEERSSFAKLYFSAPEGEDLLFKALKPFFDDHHMLKQAIVGQAIPHKLTFKVKSGKSFAKTLAYFNENGVIYGTKEDQCEWISANFNYLYKGQPKEFKKDTLLQYFTEKKIKPQLVGVEKLVNDYVKYKT